MRLRLWGTRGSIPAPGPETVRYGGNTSCVEVIGEEPGHRLILDSGTGIRHLGNAIEAALPDRVDILLTHLHSDHIMGIGFFAPLWLKGQEIHIWGPASATKTLAERMARFLSPPFFPVRMTEIPSQLQFHDAPEGEFTVEGFSVTAQRVLHQGPTVAYRVQNGDASIGYIPDHEPGLAGIDELRRARWISGYGIAHDVDLLLHDAQYSEDEYADRVGWGHSAISHTVAFAQRCEVRRLMMFHHEPRHSDAQLEALRESVLADWTRTHDESDLVIAAEGVEVEVGAGDVAYRDFATTA